MDKVSEMGEAPLGGLLLKFSLPSVAMMLVNGLYNFIDRVFIGRGMGTEGLAAVTAGFPMMLIAEGIGALLGVGAATMISIAMGAGRREEAADDLGQAFFVALAAAIPVMACSWLFMNPILGVFGTTPEILPMARRYLGIITIGFVFQIVSMAVVNSLRSQSRPRAAMVATVSGTGLNVVLAPLFIFVFKWGIAGAAWATVAAQALSAAVTLFFIQERTSILRIELRRLAPRFRTIASMARLGFPIFMVHFLVLIMLIVANNSMARFGGETALAVIGIVNAVNQLLLFPIMGITQGAGTLWGYNYGAGKFDRVKRLAVISVLWTTALSLVFTLLVELFPRALIAAFNASDPALVRLGSHGLAIFMLTFFTTGLQFTAATLFMSIGKAAQGGVLYILRQSILIGGMAVLPHFFGIEGVFWASP